MAVIDSLFRKANRCFIERLPQTQNTRDQQWSSKEALRFQSKYQAETGDLTLLLTRDVFLSVINGLKVPFPVSPAWFNYINCVIHISEELRQIKNWYTESTSFAFKTRLCNTGVTQRVLISVDRIGLNEEERPTQSESKQSIHTAHEIGISWSHVITWAIVTIDGQTHRCGPFVLDTRQNKRNTPCDTETNYLPTSLEPFHLTVKTNLLLPSYFWTAGYHFEYTILFFLMCYFRVSFPKCWKLKGLKRISRRLPCHHGGFSASPASGSNKRIQQQFEDLKKKKDQLSESKKCKEHLSDISSPSTLTAADVCRTITSTWNDDSAAFLLK